MYPWNRRVVFKLYENRMENKRKNWTSRPSTVPEKLLDFFFFGKFCLGWLNYFWVCLCYFRKKKKLDCGNLEYFLSAWCKNTLDFRGISLYWSNRNCWIHFLFAKRGAVVFSKSVCETLLTLRCQEKLLILCVFWANLMSFYFILFYLSTLTISYSHVYFCTYSSSGEEHLCFERVEESESETGREGSWPFKESGCHRTGTLIYTKMIWNWSQQDFLFNALIFRRVGVLSPAMQAYNKHTVN